MKMRVNEEDIQKIFDAGFAAGYKTYHKNGCMMPTAVFNEVRKACDAFIKIKNLEEGDSSGVSKGA